MLRLAGSAFLLAAGCHAPEAATQTPPPEVDLSTWVGETIQLPPGFAPELPSGREVLLFAPGMFDPDAEDYWSYTFLMDIAEADVDRQRLEELFELYYDGLIRAVSEGKAFEVPADPATVSFSGGGDDYRGELRTFDAFTEGQPIEVNLVVEVAGGSGERSLLRVQASPQAVHGHPVWAALGVALESLEF